MAFGNVVSARPTITPGVRPQPNPRVNALAKAFGAPRPTRPAINTGFHDTSSQPLGGGTAGAPGSPGAPGLPGASAQSPQAPPLDSTYYANVNANQFKTNNDVNALNLQGTQNDTALAKALAQLNYQQPRDSLRLEQSFNNRGGLYSSVEGQGLADLTHSYALKQSAAQTSHDQLRDSLAARIAALQGGVPIYDAQQAAASTGRQSLLAQNDPSLGQNPFASADAPFLAPGAAAPNYALTPPAGAPGSARWAGSSSPGKGWKGIGGGWWKPGK